MMAIVPEGGMMNLLISPNGWNNSRSSSLPVPNGIFLIRITVSSRSLPLNLVKSIPWFSKNFLMSPITWASARACLTAELEFSGSSRSLLSTFKSAAMVSNTASLFKKREFQLNCDLDASYFFFNSLCFFNGRFFKSNSSSL
ncbi:hypothetical protein WICPIJ_006119 [Wickerhamomyces pijperi]|uniref:Uncharacterized protein n=1 Tax=Wickerhamomyces pijperi TaxID=599730 RepID=A0A9P8Q4V8_WICPI|nr:hypothetical protein WICPIJ_006119 [Wickerhamomyces pijperi]